MVNTKKIKKRIRQAGLTQKQISKKMGISLVSVNKKINGKSPMTLPEAEGFANILKIKNNNFSEYFFSEETLIKLN